MSDSSVIRKIALLRAGAAVERCHTFPHVGSYSVGAHTFGMISLLMVLHPRPSSDLIRAIVFHDAGSEAVMGDIPAAAKREFPDICDAFNHAQVEIERREGFWVNLGQEDQAWLAGLDVAEFFLWVSDQLAMGNELARPYQKECLSYIIGMLNEGRSYLPAELREYFQHLARTAK